VVTYCTSDVTAEGNDTSKPLTALKIKDYAPISCAAPKTKIIKAGKLTSSIAIKVNQDPTTEGDEALAVIIANVASVDSVTLLPVGGGPTADPAHSAGIGRIIADD